MVIFNDGVAETALPDTNVVHTDVLIVGSGPAGSSAALFLSSLGIPNIMITKYRWTANTPRAHITNQRTMEIFRDMGIEDQVLADATPHEMIGDTVFCTSIAGEEIGRILSWGNHPARHADYELASPSLNCDIPQTYLEPILVKNATVRGTQTQFSTEYISHTQDADGVSVRVLNRLTGTEYTIRAKYLIGADGARSKVAADIGLPYEGQMDIAGSMNITFKADIAGLVGHRPSVLYWVVQPGSNIGGIGAGLVRMVRPWNEWLIVWGFDINGEPPTVTDESAAQIVRNLIGVPDLDVEITGTSLWGNNEQYAIRLQSGRVFCAGDACTSTRRATVLAPTPPSRTPTTWRGRSRPYLTGRPAKRSWIPTLPSAPRWQNRSSPGPTSPDGNSASSSKPSESTRQRAPTKCTP